MVSAYLNQPKRDIDEVEARIHRNNLQELLCMLANEGKAQRYRDAVEYAIQLWDNAAEARIKAYWKEKASK